MATPSRFLHPKWLSAHRLAALSLYKALLTGCKASGFNELQTLQITNLIKNRFRENERCGAFRTLRILFQAGYQAVDHFDAIQNGEQKSKDYLVDLLGRAHLRAKHPPNCDINKIKRGQATRLALQKASEAAEGQGMIASVQHLEDGDQPQGLEKQLYDDKVDNSAIEQDRDEEGDAHEGEERGLNTTAATGSIAVPWYTRPLPLEKLSGRRHVPRLICAYGMPVLRLRKPQSPKLGPMIAARQRQRNTRRLFRQELIDQMKTASHEDAWDDAMDALAAEQGVEPDEPDETLTMWDEAPYDAKKQLDSLLNLELRKNILVARAMQEVVDKEKAMLLKERKERKLTYVSGMTASAGTTNLLSESIGATPASDSHDVAVSASEHDRVIL